MNVDIYELLYAKYVLGDNILVSLKPVNRNTNITITGSIVTFEIYDANNILVVPEKTATWNSVTETYDYIINVLNDWPTQSLGYYFMAINMTNVGLSHTIMHRIKIIRRFGTREYEYSEVDGSVALATQF